MTRLRNAGALRIRRFLSVGGMLCWLAILFAALGSVGTAQAEAAATSTAATATIAPTLYTFIIPVAADTEVSTHNYNKNFGSDSEVKVLADSPGTHYHRPLFLYDLSSILPGSNVLTATVHFFVTNSDSNPVNIHRVTAPWDEQAVTWNSFNEGYAPGIEGVFIPARAGQYVSADVTGLVQQWVIGVRPNRGLALLPTAEKRDSKYATKEQNDPTRTSYLMVTVENDAIRTYADHFSLPGTYAGSDGSQNWAGSWVELGESNGPTAGDVLVASSASCLDGACLRIGNLAGSLTGMGIRREVDLSSAVAASLSFRYLRQDARATMHVEVSRDGGTAWHRLDTLHLNRSDSGYAYASYDLSAYLSASTQIRFIGEQIGGNTDKGILIDHVRLAYLDASALNSGIGGRIWDDLDRDYVEDVGESGLADVAVDLYVGPCGNVEPPAFRSTVTDESGVYFFPMLFAGPYCVLVDEASLPADYAATGPSAWLDVTLATTQIYLDAGFAYASARSTDRLSVGLYAPCTDISWLRTLAAANNTTFLTEDHQACTFTLAGDQADLAQLSLDLAADGRERHASADIWVSGVYLPNDPDFNDPSLVYGPQQINAPAAWDLTTGDPELIVAILDSGVDFTHPEFAGRLLPGYDFVNRDTDPTDDHGHGTHVAGIVAAGMDNALGMVGVSPRVKILPVKVLNANNSGWWSDISQGITWAVDQGAKVINLSLGGTTDSLAMRDAIRYANSRGALVVAAAGNSATAVRFYPASLDDVVALGGSSYTGDPWTLSNYGPNVDLLAPAALVWSTARNNSYQFMSGTSMAAPHAAGVAALVYSVNPNLNPSEVKQLFLDTATPMGDPYLVGAGLINAGLAVNAIQPALLIQPETSLETVLVTDLADNGVVDPGDTLRYNLLIVNNQSSSAPNVVISATIPANTTYVPGSTQINGIPTQDSTQDSPFPLDAGGLNIGSLPAQASVVVSFDVVVNPPVPAFFSLYSQSAVEIGGNITYQEENTQVGGTPCILRLTDSAGAEISALPIGDLLHLVLTDHDENSRPAVRQSVSVLAVNPTTGDTERVTLMETDVDTGIFSGSLQLSRVLGQGADDGYLHVTAAGQTVAINYVDPDFAPDQCTGSISALAPGSADLWVTQSVNDTTPDEGQTILYTVKVKNNGGPAVATSVVISNAIPAGINFIVGNATHGDFDYATGAWFVGRLPVGVEATLLIDAEVYGDSGSVINNTAFVQAVDQSDPVASNNSATVAVRVNPADLQVTKAVNITNPDEGQIVRYTVNVRNNGPAALATGIVISDVVPAGMTFVAATPAQGSYDSATGLWTVGSLASGANVTLLLDAMYTVGFSGKPITNTARVYSFDQADANPANDIASAIITPKTADLRVQKSVDNTGPLEGQTIAYTVKVKNQGPAALATSIVVSDVLPAGLTFASASAQQGSYDASTGLWTVGNLANGVEVALTLNATVKSGTSGQRITNLAQVASFDQTDTITANNLAAQDIIVAPADLRLTKTVNNSTPDEGQEVQYTVTVFNDGPSFATGIVIRDLLPATLTFVSVNEDVGVYDPATGLWTLNTTLSARQSKKMVIKARPKPGTSGQTITNRAEVASVDQLDDDPSNDAAAVNVTVNTVDLLITKTVNDNTPDELQVIDYTVSVKNNGPSFASGIVISDVLPAGMEYVSANPDVGAYDPATGLWTLNTNLSSGVTRKVVIKARPQPGTSGQTIVNRAELVAVDQVETNAGNNSATVSASVNGVDIVITTDVDVNKPGENQTIVYTVGVKNNGPAGIANGILVSDLLPNGLIFVSASAQQGSYDPDTRLWTVGSLASGVTKNLYVTAYVPNGLFNQKLTYQAQLDAVDQFELDDRNNSRSKDITVAGTDLQVTKTIKTNLLSPFQLAEYTVQVKHNGPAANVATGVVIRDILPTGVIFDSANPDQGTYDPATGLWTVGSLASGVTKKLVLKAVVQPYDPVNPTVTNTAAFHSLDQYEITTNNNSANAAFTYTSTDIFVDKKVSDKDPEEGDVIAFTVEARNLGPLTRAVVGIRDLLPPGLTYYAAAADQGSYDPGTGVWTIPDLRLWDPLNPVKVTLTLSAIVDAGAHGLTITTTASSLLYQPDPVATNNSKSAVVTVRAPDVSVTKTVNNTRPDEGETIIYTVKAKNNGPAAMDATNVVIGDILPAGLTLISALPTQGNYDAATGLWAIPAIAKGVTYDLVFTARVNPGTSGQTITNTATLVSYDQRDPNTANNVASAVIQVGIADLRVTKAVNDESPDEGQVIRYTVNVKNLGPAIASNVVISDLLPAGLTFSAYTKSQGVYDKDTGLWTVGTLAVGATANLYLDAKVNTGVSGQTIINTAAVHSLAQVDLVAANNSASAAIVVQKADIQVTKTVNDAAPDEGKVIVYTVKVKNAGPSYAADVVMEDILPAGVTYVGHTATTGIYDRATGLWVVGDLLKDATATLTIQVAVNRDTSGQTISNTARLRNMEQNDPVAANNTATVAINVRTADLRITKTVNDTTPDEGQAIAYTVKVKNQGPAAATGIQVADVLPNGLTFVSAAPTQGSYDANSGLWTVGNLNSGAEKALVLNVTVDAGTGASTITNRAGVFAVDQADKVKSNDQASIAVIVNGADLSISQSVDDATPSEGQRIRYELTLVNQGPLDAFNIQVTNRLPSGVTYSGDSSGGTYDPVTGVWTVARLNKTRSTVLYIDAGVDAGTRDRVIVTAAEIIASSQPDSLLDNNYAEAKIAIGDADLDITVSVDDASPNVGDAVQFNVQVVNQGPNSASAIEIDFPLPRALRYLSHSASVGSYNPATGIWTIAKLDRPTVAAASINAVSATAGTLTLSAVVEEGTAAQTITPTATVSGADQNDPAADNNQATASLTVHGADLSLTKIVNHLYPDIGDGVIYTVTLSNAGPDAASNVEVTDYWPDRVLFGSANPSLGSYDHATGKWTIPSLVASASATLQLSGVLMDGVESTITNIAEVTASDQPDGDSTPANHTASEDDQDEVMLFIGVPPAVDGKLDIVYSLSPDVERVCYTSGGVLFGVWHVLVRPTDNAIYTALVIDKQFVDNTYGTGAIGWPSGHSFSQLVGSDHAQFIGYDANGVEVTDFRLDYISSGFATPSGYASEGVVSGDVASVLAWGTSLAHNLNDLGYCADGDCAILGTNLLLNSPATDAFYTANPIYPDWIYDVVYEAKIDLAAFGPAGYGSLVVPYIHASPAKGGSNTIIAQPGVCPGEIGDYVWHDANADGLQGDGENGIDNVEISLYQDDGDGLFDRNRDTLIGRKTTQADGRYLFQNVQPGGYFVDVVDSSVPAGFSLKTANDPTSLITLAAGQSYRDADFGYASLDFGDAPDPTYPTRYVNDGARHIVDGITFLGAGVDSDADGQPSLTALGDDQADGNDDEDGVIFNTILRQGQWTSLDVTASRSGWLNGWIDFSVDGSWAGSDDHAIVDYPLVMGVNRIYVFVPFNAAVGTTYARFRFSTQSGLSYTGEAPNGEVEDYRIEIEAPVGGASSPGSIGNFVWHDQDGDGIQDPGEPSIPGVVVILTDWLGMTFTQTTTANTGLGGNYTFDNLPAGTYTVTLDPASVPASYTFITTPDRYEVILDLGREWTSADFGLQSLVNLIGDYIWYDANGNGIQDVGEPGIGNVTLDLYLDDGDGIFEPSPGLGSDTWVDSTVTDIHGSYRLVAPTAGGYFVDVTDRNGALAGLVSTFGPQSITDPSTLISVTQDEIYRDADFGYVRIPSPALIGDQVWLDGNANGVYEPHEPVLIGVEICATPIAGGASLCATTDLNGRYLLDLPPGDYSVSPAQAPLGLTVTTPTPYLVRVEAGQQVLSADFGFRGDSMPYSSLGGVIWQDLPVADHTDGIFQIASEPGIPNVRVNLIRDVNADGIWDDGEPILATLSQFGSGEYLFNHLLSGHYLVRVADTLGVLRYFAPTVLGPNPGQDNNNQAQPYGVNLASGETNTTADFGYREYEAFGQGAVVGRGLIGDQIWFDLDGDGVYNPESGDQPVAGVTLEVRRSGASAPLATATTGAYGQYSFTDLPLGQPLEVRVTDLFGVLAGYTPTVAGPNPGQDNNSQSQPYAITLGLVSRNTTADFGYLPTGSHFTLTKELLGFNPVRVGEVVTFSLRITNTGVTVITKLPVEESYDMEFFTFLQASLAPDGGPGSGPTGRLVWQDLTGTTGELAPGAEIELRIAFLAKADTTLEANAVALSTATIADVTADPDGTAGPAPAFLARLAPRSVQAGVMIVNPTAARLAAGGVVLGDAGAVARWQTVSEVDVAGFNLLRAEGEGETLALNPEVIVAQKAGQAEGAAYEWVDVTALAEMAYTYSLEIIRLDGSVERYELGSVAQNQPIFLPLISR